MIRCFVKQIVYGICILFLYVQSPLSAGITGRVTNGQAPIDGAQVFVANYPSDIVYTDSNGEFDLVVTSGVSRMPIGFARDKNIRISSKQISFTLPSTPTEISVQFISLKGTLIASRQLTGQNSLNISLDKLLPRSTGAQVLLLMVSLEGNSHLFKMILSENGIRTASAIGSKATGKRAEKSALAKSAAAAIDTVVIQKAGYSSKRLPVKSYTADLDDITLTSTAIHAKLTKHGFETGFPAYVNVLFNATDTAGKGIDYLGTADFRVTENGTNVSPTETNMKIKRMDEIPYALQTVLLLDNSPSVRDDFANIQNAALSLVANIVPKQEIAIYSFHSQITLAQDFTADTALLNNAIRGLTVPLGSFSTDLYGAIIEGVGRYSDVYSIADTIRQGFVVAITDGADETANHTLSETISARGNKWVYMVGLGNEIDSTSMKSIGNKGFYPVTDISTLGAVFTGIQNDISLYAKSFYWLYYLSGKRNNQTHTLRLEIKNNQFSGAGSYIEATFESSGFTDLPGGTYVNASQHNPAGIDTIYLLPDKMDTLKAVSHWGENPSRFLWHSDDESIASVTIDPDDDAVAYITFAGELEQEVMVSVVDSGNIASHSAFSKTILLKLVEVTVPGPMYGNSMVTVTGGTFDMGSTSVTVSSFWMDRTEVTQKEYGDVMSATYSGFSAPSWYSSYGVGDNNPAYNVNWYDAVLYCNARTKASGSSDTVYSYTSISGTPGNDCGLGGLSIDLSKQGYRLPTEAEWEYACRGGTTTDYYWGSNSIDDYAWYSGNSGSSTHPVAQKLPNAYGLYDMSGNVWESCNDWYGSYSSGSATNPTGPSSGSSRVRRGGGWDGFASDLRSAYRGYYLPDYEYYGSGFRVVLPAQ